ncbi:hypothetical protein ACSBR1_000991 [Camellia fascicularis]
MQSDVVSTEGSLTASDGIVELTIRQHDQRSWMSDSTVGNAVRWSSLRRPRGMVHFSLTIRLFIRPHSSMVTRPIRCIRPPDREGSLTASDGIVELTIRQHDQRSWISDSTVGNAVRWSSLRTKKPTLSNQFVPFHVLFVFVMILELVFSFNSTTYAASATTKVGEDGAEVVALLTWKASLDNQSQSLLLSWARSNHCNWIGIHCNNADRVTHIDLESNGLRGTLSNLNFSFFPQLLSLKLHNNSIYGTIPSKIGSLVTLTHLDLSNNYLSGTIPS